MPLFRPGNLSCTGRNSKSMVALAISSLDTNNFIHFPPGLMILKTYLSTVVVVPVHLCQCCSSIIFVLVENSLSQFNFDFPMFQIMTTNIRLRKIKIELV